MKDRGKGVPPLESADGIRLARHTWPAERARSVVAIVHGWAEHGGRYARHAAQLTTRGIGIQAYDHRGHGLSGGPRAYVRSFQRLVDDCGLFLDDVKARSGDLPVVVFGHSLGATIAALAEIERPGRCCGLVLSSAAIVFPEPAWLQRSSLWLEHVLPSMPTYRLDRTLLSPTKEVRQQTDRDPLYYRGRIRVATGAQLIRAGRRVLAEASVLRTPLLIIHGTDDRITLPDGSRMLYGQAGASDKSLCLFPGAYHETFNGEHGERVWDRVAEFVERLTAG